MKFAAEIPVEELHEWLSYDAATGVMRWKKSRGARAPTGGVVGTPKAENDYLIFQVKRVLYRLHRVAWAMHYGVWPDDEVDHRNLNRQDNRIENLRIASREKNAANAPNRIPGRLKGTATRPKGGFTAQIGVNRKKVHLGCFDTEEAAHAAYCAAAEKYFGSFARAGRSSLL